MKSGLPSAVRGAGASIRTRPWTSRIVSVVAPATRGSAAKATAPRLGFGEADQDAAPTPAPPTPVVDTPMPTTASEDVIGLTNKPAL